MNINKTEKLVRKCFRFCFSKGHNLCGECIHWRFVAKSARRFVRMEQAEKFKQLAKQAEYSLKKETMKEIAAIDKQER